MKILYAYSEKLSVPSVTHALIRMGHEIEIYTKPMEEFIGKVDDKRIEELRNFLENKQVDFVLSIIYIPVLAELTHALEIKYAVYGMDSPMYATYRQTYDNCFLFYFDYKEYQMLKREGRANIYYLPLAGDVKWADNLVITDAEVQKYSCDMSFVGSLYCNNPYDNYIGRFPAEIQRFFSSVLEKSAFQWDGKDRIEERLIPELYQLIRKLCPELFDSRCKMTDEYYLKSYFFARKLTHIERTLLIEMMSERYDVHLFTKENENVPDNINRHPPTDSEEALKIFFSSKINLNITMRSIASGIPKRVFDIMSVGGFVLSNYQEEISDLFEEGKEIVTFKTPEELIEKADYYLEHEDERIQIGMNGYQKVKNCYTYEHQLSKIISILYPDL